MAGQAGWPSDLRRPKLLVWQCPKLLVWRPHLHAHVGQSLPPRHVPGAHQGKGHRGVEVGARHVGKAVDCSMQGEQLQARRSDALNRVKCSGSLAKAWQRPHLSCACWLGAATQALHAIMPACAAWPAKGCVQPLRGGLRMPHLNGCTCRATQCTSIATSLYLQVSKPWGVCACTSSHHISTKPVFAHQLMKAQEVASHSLIATSAKPLAGAARAPFGGAAPPKIWKSIVPRNSATSWRENVCLICPSLLM